jgi:rare lipoprotein A
MKPLFLILALCLMPYLSYANTLKASWYSRADLIRDGQDKITHFIMANGKEFFDNGYTCASWDFRLGTRVKVTNKQTGKSVIVQVTDRTARRFKGKRIDLSKGSFAKLANISQGIIQVSVEVIK